MKSNNKATKVATLILGTILISGLAYAHSEVPDNVKIESLIYAGTGCPAGTVAESLADDNQAFTLIFDDFVAEVGPFVSRRESRKFCQMNLALSYTPGWSFAVIELDTRGYVGLDKKVKATEKTSFYFQGSETMGSFEENFTGYIDDDYDVYNSIPFDAAIWSPCDSNRSLNIKTSIRLNNRKNKSGSGIITADSIDGQMAMVYGISWKRCPGWPVDDHGDDDDDLEDGHNH